MKGALVASILFFLLAMIGLIGSVVIYTSRENTDTAKSKEILKSIQHSYQSIDKRSIDQAIEVGKLKTKLDEYQKKIEWLEAKASVPQTKIIHQDRQGPLKLEPVTVNLIYRKPVVDKSANAKVIKKTKERLRK